jgi:hypothetical protein
MVLDYPTPASKGNVSPGNEQLRRDKDCHSFSGRIVLGKEEKCRVARNLTV